MQWLAAAGVIETSSPSAVEAECGLCGKSIPAQQPANACGYRFCDTCWTVQCASHPLVELGHQSFSSSLLAQGWLNECWLAEREHYSDADQPLAARCMVRPLCGFFVFRLSPSRGTDR
jgi:hypothetical protein